MDKWLLSLNIEKCKVVSYGKSKNCHFQYSIDDHKLEKLDENKGPRGSI